MGFLDRYRVLDLSDHRGLLAGRILADLGADVVQAEPWPGSPARSGAPSASDGTSCHWSAYAANKRGVVYDPASDDGRLFVSGLAGSADVIIESAGPGNSSVLGLEREPTLTNHPGLVWCSITSFGPSGPKSQYAESDLTVWAASGALHPSVDESAKPIRISAPQAYLHAGADAAVGVMLALVERRRSGLGQLVEISAFLSASFATLGTVVGAPVVGARDGHLWDAKDGRLQFALAPTPTLSAFTKNLLSWMASEGADVGGLQGFDWIRSDSDAIRAAVKAASPLVAEFFAARSMAEIIDGASRFKVLVAPVFTIADVATSPQLAARDFWRVLGEDGEAVTVPGPFASIDQPAFEFRRPAPRLGEHNAQVAADWLPPGLRRRGPQSDPIRRDSATDRTGFLAGLKVLDFSWAVAGPSIGRTLGDFGASVIKIESSKRLDAARTMPALYDTTNAGKSAMCLDLAAPAGNAVARDLIRWADVVVESFSPGVMKRVGLDPELLRRQHPELIILSSSLCGQNGPWSNFAGFGNAGSALTGMHDLTGHPDRPPVGPYGPYTDYMAPRYSLVAVLAALDWRKSSKQGCWIDLAQVETAVHFLAPEIVDFFASGRVASRLGNRDLRYVPHGVFACRPAGGSPTWIAIAVTDDDDWRQISSLLTAAGIGINPGWDRLAARAACEDQIEDAIAEWTRGQTVAEVERRLQTVSIPCHAVTPGAAFPYDEQVEHLGYIANVAHPEQGSVMVEGSRYALRDTPARTVRRAPLMNEHAREVLTDALGYPPDRIDQLERDGVLT